jgi:peptidyl-prolyl cis-trans isomerase D
MLNLLRKKRNIKIIMFLIAILTVPAFILWGTGSALRMRRKVGYAGEIFSKKIRTNQYLKNYKAIYNQALLIYGDNLSKISKYLNLELQTWDRLILLHEAKRRKIKITNKELAEWIENSALFQRNGKFDKKSYEYIVKYYLGATPHEFEEQVRDNLKIKKLIDEVKSEVSVSDKELWERYKRENNKYTISYIILRPISFYDKVKINEEGLENFYQKNKELFKKPEQADVEYISVKVDDFKDKVKITNEEIKTYWEENRNKFKKDKNKEPELTEEIRKKIEEILKSKKAKELAEDKIWDIRDELGKEKDLKKVAEKFNLKVNETGYFSPQQPIPGIGWSFKFTETAFSIKKGEFSDPIKTSSKFYILELVSKKPPYIPELKEVKEEVETKYKEERAKELAREEAESLIKEFRKKIKEGKTLEEVIKTHDLELKKGKELTEKSYLPGVGNVETIISKIKNTKKGELLPQVIETRGGYVIARLDELKQAPKEEFQKSIKIFQQKVLKEKQKKHFKQWFNDLRQRANLQIYIKPQT